MGIRKSAMRQQHRFSEIPSANIARSTFDRSCGVKTTFDEGWLIPIFVDEALPGDTFQANMHHFARLSTPLHPIMDNLYIDTFFFAVPNRLLWDNWEKFNGAQDNPGDSTDYTIPTRTSSGSGYSVESLPDYMGIPIEVPNTETSTLWFRAYNLIWNEWFRDENVQNSLPVPTDDGPDDAVVYAPQRRGKRHDYFSSALPWPQKGPAVELPLGSTAPVTGSGTPTWTVNSVPYGGFEVSSGGPANDMVLLPGAEGATGDISWDDTGGLTADLSSATAATINNIREAFQAQRMLERDARGGTRYSELLRSHFGVISPDSRLQRPEYLGGGTSPILVNQVPQTSETGTTPQGSLAAYAISADSRHVFNKSFTEHCVIIGMACVRADLNYQRGLDRMWSRKTRYDFYWPSLSHLGEQEVLQKELYMDGTAQDDTVFGYQERYAEYRYKPSLITGKMRSVVTDTLDSWHLAQDFSVPPALNPAFIEERPPLDRVVAVTNQPKVIMDAHFTMKCTRPMPTYSVPGFVDHF